MVGDRLQVDYIPVTCTHCARPACAEVCPTKAIQKGDDGIVLIEPSLCNGCLACIPACPFGVIRFNENRNIVEKCNLCSRRVEKGLKPACVHHCDAGAILFGEINEVCRKLMEGRLQRRILAADNAQL